MHYWNKSSYEALDDISRALSSDPSTELLAGYCKLREGGLRKSAFAKLREFLSEVQNLSEIHRQDIAIRILELSTTYHQAHQFLSKPLLDDFISPTLENWHETDRENVVPIRWLGLLRNDAVLLEEALTRAPEDHTVRRRLVMYDLNDLDYATHHLSEGILLCDVKECRNALQSARNWLHEIDSSNDMKVLVEEIEKYQILWDDWESYKENSHGTFSEWCHEHGKNYEWPSIFYYKGKST